MPQINTIKAILLSVLIVTGSAVSSEASSSGTTALASFMSNVSTLALKSVMEVQSFLAGGHWATLFSIGG